MFHQLLAPVVNSLFLFFVVGFIPILAIFPFFSVLLGWIACFLSGSDTSSNALFGNLQVVAARQLKLSPVLMAATNSSGAVMGKMVSPVLLRKGYYVTLRSEHLDSLERSALFGAI